MGNCLKSGASIDDVSLITDSAHQGDHVSGSSPTYQPESIQSVSHQSLPIYYPAPCSSARHISQMAEEEQIQIAKRIGLIQHLPTGTYDGGGSSKKSRECVICMIEFVLGDSIRFLPCMHTYHVKCIDDWLMRSFICPSCMEPVDAALLSTFQ